MAYVFDQTNSQLGGDQGDQKQNIFQNTGPSDQNQNAGAEPQGQNVKTSTEGSLDSTKSSGGSSTPTAGSGGGAGQSGATGGQRQSVFNKQAEAIQTPGALGNVQSNLSKANSDLQNEANSYESAAGQKDYTGGVTSGDVTNAIVKGSNDSYSKISQALNQANPNVEGFAPKTDYKAPGSQVEGLNTQAGLQDLMKKDQGAYYTPQEAAFDARLLGRNTGFQQTNQALQAQNKSLQDYATSLQDPTLGAQAIAQKNANDAYLQQKQGLQGQIQGYQDNIVSDLKAKALQASQSMPQGQAMQDIISKKIADEIANEKAQYALSHGGQNDFTGRALSNISEDNISKYVDPLTGKSIDFSQYFTPNQIDPNAQSGYGQFANQDQVNQFNRVLSLLGTGGQQLQLPQTPYSPYNVNTGGLDNAITSAATGLEGGVERDATSQIQQILDSARAQAQSFNSQTERGANNQEYLKRAENQLGGNWSPEQIKAAEQAVDPAAYYQAGKQVSDPNQFLLPDQISKLRSLGQVIGQDPNMYQGSTMTPEGDQFQAQAYAEALRAWLQRGNTSMASAPSAGKNFVQSTVDTLTPKGPVLAGPNVAPPQLGGGHYGI